MTIPTIPEFTERFGIHARIARVKAIKAEARAHPYHARQLDPSRDYRNLRDRLSKVQTRIENLRKAGRKGHWTYDQNPLNAALAERLALRYRRALVFSDMHPQVEAAE